MQSTFQFRRTGLVIVLFVLTVVVPVFGQGGSDRAFNMGPLNSTASEVAPIITADGNTVYFTSDRPGGVGGQDFWMSTREGGKWTEPINIRELNTTRNEGPDTITADGKTMYYTGCNRREDGSDKCDIYVTQRSGDGKWRPGENLGPPINTDYEEANATVSADGQMMVFTSNRPGGLGSYDLWTSMRKSDGTWGEPTNLGPSINSSMWEGVAFLHSDGVTMYFSSNGHGGFGNGDIFETTRKPDGSWSDPVNMGGLINSPYNDIYFTVPAAGDLAYFSSSSEGGLGREDLYAIPKELIFKSRDYVVVRGRVTDIVTGKPVAAMLTATGGPDAPQKTTSDPKRGNYHYRLKIGSIYTINANAAGYLDNTSRLNLTVADPFHIVIHNIKMQPIDEMSARTDVEPCPDCPQCPEYGVPENMEEILIDGGTIVVNDVLFNFDKHTLREPAVPILERIVIFMEDNPRVRIRIDGYTDSVGPDAYNLRLSIRRANTVRNYMMLRGVSGSRVIARGHGENNLVAEDDPVRGNIKNRRVEFSLVKGSYRPTSNPRTSMRGKQPPNDVIAVVASADPRMIQLPPKTTHLEIRTAVVATDIINREPRGVSTVFRNDVKKLYFHNQVIGAQEDITISHYWYYRNRLISQIPLDIMSSDFRTWSSIDILPTWSGRMRVEVINSNGNLMRTIGFKLNPLE